MTPDEFQAGRPTSKSLYVAIARAAAALGDVSVRVTKSQIAFRRRKNFTSVWLPSQYLRGKTAPLVLTLSFPDRDPSPRWKEVVAPSPGHFTLHLALHRVRDVDAQVRGWLRVARESAG